MDIHVENLCKTYREGLLGGKKIEALQGASMQVQSGEIFGLLGPNGAGKTTLIKILLGIVRKTSGDATVLDRPAGDRLARQKMGYLPEGHRLPRHLTGDTALDYYGGLSGLSSSDVRKQRDELLDLVGLKNWGKTPVRKYSKGMQQRIGLAQAMLHKPQLLILDEPTDGVDPQGRAEIRAVLKRLKEAGKTVFLNSHLLQELELVCDRVAVMVGGKVRKIGPVTELTSVNDLDVQISVAGREDDILTALGSHAALNWETINQGDLARHSFVVQFSSLLELNGYVDRLRAANLQIYSIVPQRRTLEQVFLELVGNQRTAGAVNRNPSEAAPAGPR